MPRVLVTDAEQRSSLAVVRSLGRAGHRVEVCSAHSAPLAGASRYATADHVVSDPTEDLEAFRSDLLELVRRRSIDVVLPMTDATAVASLDIRDRLSDAMMPFPSTTVWRQASDKSHLVEVARSLDVPVPEQRVAAHPGIDLAEILDFARSVGFPVVLKPHRSAAAGRSRVLRFSVKPARDADELERMLRGFPEEAFPVLVQQRVDGPGLGGFFLARDGRVLQAFAHERLREKPPTGGVSVLRRSIPLRRDVERHSAALLEHFGWSGVAMVEFKLDGASDTPYLMEINGRFWGSLQLAIDAGIDFPRMLLESFEDDGRSPRDEAPTADRTGSYRSVSSRWLWGDVDHLLWILRAPRGYRRDRPDLPGRLEALARFMLPWRPGRRCEVFRVSDPKPFLRESRQWLAHATRRR